MFAVLRVGKIIHHLLEPFVFGSVSIAVNENIENGVPGEIRTLDHRLRRQVLYPAELRGHKSTLALSQMLSIRLFAGL
jgi:hypothetical protein